MDSEGLDLHGMSTLEDGARSTYREILRKAEVRDVRSRHMAMGFCYRRNQLKIKSDMITSRCFLKLTSSWISMTTWEGACAPLLEG